MEAMHMNRKMRKMRLFSAHCALAALLLTSAAAGQGSELVYTPVNPSFGGNPLNGSVLMNAAQAQNKTKDPDSLQSKTPTTKTALEQFNEMLERAVLNRLASAAIGDIIGENGELIDGNIETQNFIISITDLNNGMLEVTTTDKWTNTSTSFQISNTSN